VEDKGCGSYFWELYMDAREHTTTAESITRRVAQSLRQSDRSRQQLDNGVGEDGVTAFTQYGIECLKQTIADETGNVPPPAKPTE
jgi:hypothetical protein